MGEFQLQIITPQRVAFDDKVESLVAPGEAGYLGVLADHAPLLTTLGDGTLTVRGVHATRVFKISGGGFLEVCKNKVLVLAKNVQE